jgi:hypothetical protein
LPLLHIRITNNGIAVQTTEKKGFGYGKITIFFRIVLNLGDRVHNLVTLGTEPPNGFDKRPSGHLRSPAL